MNLAPLFRRARTVLPVWSLWACQGSPLDGPGAPPAAPTIQVSADGASSLEALPRVFRLHIEPAPELSGTFSPDMLLLFHGELTSYYRGRLAAAELPNTLLERTVVVSSWEVPSGFELQPSEVLAPGSYALGLLGWGGLTDLVVLDDGSPVLYRVWPAPEEGGAAGALYCADSALVLEPKRLTLAPEGQRGDWQPNALLPDRCVELSVANESPLSIPPPRADGALVDPAPLAEREAPFALQAELECSTGEYAIAAGCVEVLDDRIRVTPRSEPQLWWVSVNGAHQAVETRDALPFVIAGLMPEADQLVEGEVFDVKGATEPVELEFRTQPARPHLAVNEVYADANGPEPEQEWVELVNSGTVVVDLGGWVLEDVGGQTELPAAQLEPGGFAVIVNESYVPDADYDLLIDPFAVTLRVPSLGKSGLSNSGELIRLRTPEGEIVSRFPGVSAKPGRSVARRVPWSLDEALDGFGWHADPGASPGAPNVLAEQQ